MTDISKEAIALLNAKTCAKIGDGYTLGADEVAELLDVIKAQGERIEALETMSGAAKALSKHIPNEAFDVLEPILIGEYSEDFTAIDEDGDEVNSQVSVSWTTTKDIISDAIAALKGGPTNG